MLNLAASDILAGVAGTATAVTYTITGMELNAGVEAYKVLAQGQLPSSVGTLYTAPSSTQTFIKSLHLANATGSDVTGIKIFLTGTTAGKQITGSLTIPANGWATYEEDGWRVYNASGQVLESIANISAGGSSVAGTRGVVYEALPYTFSTSTTNGDPGAGTIRFLTSISTIRDTLVLLIDDVDANAVSRAAFFAAIDVSQSYRNCTVSIRSTTQNQDGILARVQSVSPQSGYTVMGLKVLAMNPAAPISNAAAITITFHTEPKGQVYLPVPNASHFSMNGVPGFQKSHYISNLALSINTTYCVPFFNRYPILINAFLANVSSNAACNVRFGIFNMVSAPAGNAILGDQYLLIASVTNFLNVGGIRSAPTSGIELPAGYWWLTAQVVGGGSPAVHAPAGDYEDGWNLDYNLTSPLITHQWNIANSGGTPAVGDTITRTTATLNAGASNALQSRLPFYMQYGNMH
jgi:hypothetical protein